MRVLLLTALLTGLTAGCRPDDVAGDSGAATGGADGGGADGSSDGADGGGDGGSDGADGGDGGDSALTGAWRSEGDDLAPLFRNAFYDYKTVDVVFESGGTYTGAVETNDGETASIAGTYTMDASTTPGTISLTQTEPAAAGTLRSEGIWQIDGDRLDYEIVLVEPNDYGCAPPTPSSGFGTSDCSGAPLSEGDLWQIYRKQ